LAPSLVPDSYLVGGKRQETEDTWTLRLKPVAGPGLRYEPGQFTMLYAFGVGEAPISVSGDPAGAGELVQTIRAVGAVTGAICALEEGEQLGVRGPFGRGWPVTAVRGGDVVVVAGGVGLAPLRPAIYALLAERDSFERVILLYGGRMPDQLLFQEELEAWRGRGEIEVETIVDAATAGWRGRVGVVPSLVERCGLDGARTSALVCGPEVMMRFTATALTEAGVASERISLSMERNMRCAVGHCGHCQWGGSFVCRHGPVFSWNEISERIAVREL
jgi:NAD(P)H-flavin reductase